MTHRGDATSRHAQLRRHTVGVEYTVVNKLCFLRVFSLWSQLVPVRERDMSFPPKKDRIFWV